MLITSYKDNAQDKRPSMVGGRFVVLLSNQTLNKGCYGQPSSGGDCGQVNIFNQPSAGDPKKVPSMEKKATILTCLEPVPSCLAKQIQSDYGPLIKDHI